MVGAGKAARGLPVIVFERKIRGVDTRVIALGISHAMRTARRIGRVQIELEFEHRDEGIEQIQEQTVRTA